MKKTLEICIYIIITVAVVLSITFLVKRNSTTVLVEYNNEYFNIPDYISSVDKDGDGIDDQTDMLNNAKNYIKNNPKYKSEYYDGGYPKGEYGVCTDVIAIAMLNSGYDLMELVNEHIISHRDMYDIEKVDKNIDFRRVRNLEVYFKDTAISLTTDIYDIKEWQGGDIVVFKTHIGMVSDKRNSKGIPYIIHHANLSQKYYEEDVLEWYLENDEFVIGHYRIT